jgi:hypothetical protein
VVGGGVFTHILEMNERGAQAIGVLDHGTLRRPSTT